MATLTNSSFLLESDFLAGEDRDGERQEDTVTKIRDTMDNIWTRLRKGWGKKATIVKSIQGPPPRTYCTAYHRLAGGDEIFCDELDYTYPEEDFPCPEEDSPTLIRDSFIPPTTTDNPPCKTDPDLLTPDSGTFSPSEYENASPKKVPKSMSLQFPRVLKLPFSRSLNFCVFQPSSLTSPGMQPTTSSVSVGPNTPCSLLEEEEEDYDWDEEELTCNVCDRSFQTPRQLERHQLRKRHWGCDACDNLFNSLMDLEHHKEELNHWSDDEYESDEEYNYYGEEEDEESDCDCGCSYKDKLQLGHEDEEETEFGPEKEEQEMLL